MRPLSRGKDPIEFSLRIMCKTGQQFSFSGASSGEFFVSGVRCFAIHENSSLLITATGFPDASEARHFFHNLQHVVASVSLQERIDISFPLQLSEPVEATLSFMEHDTQCLEHGWPEISIRPLLIQNYGAWVYPEHEYVAIEESIAIVPRFSHSLTLFLERINETESQADPAPNDEVLLFAVASYVQAVRSTQWVWSFLLAIMTLEMLATETPTSESTRAAVRDLAERARFDYQHIPSVDLHRILSSLNQAKRISKKSAVRVLVKKYCSPGIAEAPLDRLFVDEADCDRKVGAMYDIRSIYMHEGRVTSSKKPRYSFHELHDVALTSLGHILKEKLNNSTTIHK